ncbi:phosphatidylserine/phosphatidylglycerophosphate/cardiolipin synthase family protein [Streptomyces sp. SM12]|uniref:phospholipase D-like domain-containing protein n=1 Tax=Streptomyces sp. SM12 TaxID=1071602 RepID=UPI000CD4D8A1|nr:phospholipase D-like domain-containing protein [Streptomyces sp. SM12]
MTAPRTRRGSRFLIAAPIAALTVLGTLLPAAWPGAATASEPTPTRQTHGAYTVFNTPSPVGDPDTTLESHIVELVDATPAGESIHGALYSWTREPVAEALARAQARGVSVSLAIDKDGAGNVNSDPSNTAMAVLRDAGLTRLVFCGNTSRGNTACIGNRDNSINHNKVFTFSTTGDMSNVVLVASHNLTNTQNSLHNNAVVLHEDADLYQAFQRHMSNLLAQRKNNNYYRSADGYFRSPTSDIRVFFSPYADSSGGTDPEASTDLIAGRLSYITRYQQGCSVDVAHAQFTGPRAAVADELIRIGALGCRVRVIGGEGMTTYITDRLAGKRNVTVRRLDELHSKYIVYSGDYNGTAGRNLVFTGSQNLTGPALRSHDETFIRVEHPDAVGGYEGNFALLWSRAR